MLDPKKLRDLRQAKNLSQSEFSALCKIGASYYPKLENPKAPVDPTLSKLEKIAAGAGCEIKDLLSDGDPSDRANVIVQGDRVRRLKKKRRVQVSFSLPADTPDDEVERIRQEMLQKVTKPEAMPERPDPISDAGLE